MKTRSPGLFCFSLLLLCAFFVFAEEPPPVAPPKDPAKRPGTVVINRSVIEKEKHYKFIPLETLDYATLNSICRPWLSEGGIMTYEKARNSVLIYDTNEVIDKIAKFVGELDREAVNIRIDVDFIETGSKQDDQLRIDVDSGLSSHQQLVFENGKWVRPKNISISPKMNRDSSSKLNAQTIVTRNGYAANLWVGNTMIDPSWLNNLILTPTVVISGGGGTAVIPAPVVDFKWVDVGSKLKVCPHYQDNGNIEVELYPEVSYLDGEGKTQTVKVEQLVTRVLVRDGQRFYLGGAISSDRNTMTKLFGPEFYTSRGSNSILDTYLTATVLKPSGRPLNKKAPDGKPEFRH